MQDSDCCTNNCFGFACAERVSSCGQGSAALRCQPPANGCAGNTCCHGSLACDDTCCQSAANQCNPQNACCVPNCADRQCGDDGCGNGETCGSCATGQTCDATTGTCQGGVTCSAQNCPTGCCGATGTCQPGNTPQACGAGGAACAPCPAETGCKNGVCVLLDSTFNCHCFDGEQPPFCAAAVCNAETIETVCTALCSNHGGLPQGACVPRSCLV